MPLAAKKSVDDSAKKRRRVSATNEEQAILTAVAASESRDYDYITDTLKARPDLTTYIARLLRDGALDKALNARAAPTVPDSLGKKIASACGTSPRSLSLRCSTTSPASRSRY